MNIATFRNYVQGEDMQRLVDIINDMALVQRRGQLGIPRNRWSLKSRPGDRQESFQRPTR